MGEGADIFKYENAIFDLVVGHAFLSSFSESRFLDNLSRRKFPSINVFAAA